MAIWKEKINTVHDLSITRVGWLGRPTFYYAFVSKHLSYHRQWILEIKAIITSKNPKLQNFYGKLYIFMIRYHGVQ